MRIRVLLLCLLTIPAQARVFDINKEKFAGYFSVNGGGSAIGTAALDGEAANSPTYDNGIKYNYGGEFGVIYSRPGASLRFGFEIIRPMLLESTATLSGAALYSATSSVLGYAPKLALEVNLHGNNRSRSYITAGAGAATITIKNEYLLTTAGSAAYSGVVDHTVESKGSGTVLSAALGYEGELADTTTITVEFGYRQLKVDNFAYTKDVTTFSGAKVSGDKHQDVDGNARSLDFSGAFLAIGFRFYL